MCLLKSTKYDEIQYAIEEKINNYKTKNNEQTI